MKRFIILLLIGLVAYSSRSLWLDSAKSLVPPSFIDSFQSIDFSNFSWEAIDESIKSFLSADDYVEPDEPVGIEFPDLVGPDSSLFSVHNIELGDTRAIVEEDVGSPKRVTENEYGLNWEAYHEEYHRFMMVAYDEENRVKGLYTNQDLIASTETEIQFGSNKAEVRDQLGVPQTSMRKGFFNYQLNQDEEYDLFELDDSYLTIFYDKHRDDTVTAIQIIDYDLEQSKRTLYTEESQALREGFEYQLFDLTNSSRSMNELPLLTWDDPVRETARKHSTDMAVNEYFGHTNLEGKSPFDRMADDNIRFTTAGENLAYGQFSSIFAHEGLMNSLGHRENILKKEFRNLGVGVDFNDDSQPYYTEKFFTR
ncbi:hypothetical protein JCM19046_1447 [Bacillus sp. JCM 19046]|nr:hypothetical protein JCM19046_1447 [Bacillus sp. JCM 19046]